METSWEHFFLGILQEIWNQGLIAGEKKEDRNVQNISSRKLKFIMGRSSQEICQHR